MRLTYIFLTIFLFSCTQSKYKGFFIPKEYEYPEDSLLNKKTFTYEDISIGKIIYCDYVLKNKNLIETHYSNSKTYDSTIYCNGKTIETYSSPFDEKVLIKCNIIQDTIIKNETKFGKRVRTTFLTEDSSSVLSSVISEYLNDTSLTWNNQTIPCVVVRQHCKDEYRDGKDSMTDILLYSQTGYYGKHIGLIKYTIYFHNKADTIELKQINDKK